MNLNLDQLKKTFLSLHGLIVYEDLLQDKIIRDFYRLLAAVTGKHPDPKEIWQAYFQFFRVMLGRSWPDHLVQCLLNSQNIFAEQASRQGPADIDPMVRQSVLWDLAIVQKLAAIKPSDLKYIIAERFAKALMDETGIGEKAGNGATPIYKDDENWPTNWPEWETTSGTAKETFKSSEGLNSPLNAQQWLLAFKNRLLGEFLDGKSWSHNYNLLANFYRKAGCGILANYAAFRIKNDALVLEGIENPDPIRLSNLYCQEREQEVVLKNTESFLQNYPANNIILYGSRGTGKSSLVKALLNEYVAQGLRLIQLKKSQIKFFPELVRELADSPLKFIFFIDDLSFNEEEDDYRNIKSLLEGGIEARPQNILIYATSNRRHFVKESFSERQADDVHAADTMDEKLSLADRFGITVTFLSPDQESYLKIVEGLARESGIEIDGQLLRQKALNWAMLHNGRSGRTARQFIDNLRAELALN